MNQEENCGSIIATHYGYEHPFFNKVDLQIKKTINMSGPKYRIDVAQQHTNTIQGNLIRMKEIEKENPKEYFFDKEWRKLQEENRQAYHSIDAIQLAKQNGAKF